MLSKLPSTGCQGRVVWQDKEKTHRWSGLGFEDWRRGWDSNPRSRFPRSAVEQTAAGHISDVASGYSSIPVGISHSLRRYPETLGRGFAAIGRPAWAQLAAS